MIYYSKGEDRLNTWSHAAGIVIGIVMGYIFLSRCILAGDGLATLSIVLYLMGMLACYVSSTAYHGLPSHSTLRDKLRNWDHAAIYWHIAGSYSPVTLIAMRDNGLWGYRLFAFQWAAAAVGTFVSFRKLEEHSHLEIACFLAMGLSVLAVFKPFMDCVEPHVVGWIIAEGAFYVIGALIFAVSPNRPYFHAVFHFFVLGGTISHLVCVWFILQQFL